MTGKDLLELGFTPGPAIGLALAAYPNAEKAIGDLLAREVLNAILHNPDALISDPHFAAVAKALVAQRKPPAFQERETPAPWRQWGENLEPEAVQQLSRASRLPVSVAGALMPDAHVGYGLPIGGVLATENAVIPYGVGVDIACRMKLSVFELPGSAIETLNERLISILQRETLFGTGAGFAKPEEHAVLDEDWNVTPETTKVADRARRQLGSSGSGNHFVE